MPKPKLTRPKWVDINELANNIKVAESHLLKRKAIFENISNSETATDKDRNTAKSVIEQIDDICTDNRIVLKDIKSIVATKTHLKPRAGIKEKDQQLYLSQITRIDTRLSATGAFDEMLLQKLGIVLKKNTEGEKDE